MMPFLWSQPDFTLKVILSAHRGDKKQQGMSRNALAEMTMRVNNILVCSGFANSLSLENIRHFSEEISRSPSVFSFSYYFMPPLILFHFQLQTHNTPFESSHSGHRSGSVSQELYPQSPIGTRQVTWVGKATCSRLFVILDCFFFKL